MLSQEDVVEIVALHRRGWSVSAIARHTGRDRKTVRAWLAGERDRERCRAPSPLEPFRAYVERRLGDDPHLDATVLLRELVPLGFERSYPTLTRELRRLGLRPVCEVCKRGGHRLTIELAHEPGEELQLDWLELPETPWGGPAHVLVGALSHSGRIRAVVSEGEDFAHLAAALDGVLRRLGGTARCWRTDRMATIVVPGSGRLRAEAAEQALVRLGQRLPRALHDRVDSAGRDASAKQLPHELRRVAAGDPVSDRQGRDGGLQSRPESAARNVGRDLRAGAAAAVGAAQTVEPVLAHNDRERRQPRHLVARRPRHGLALHLAEKVAAAAALRPVIDHHVDRLERRQRAAAAQVAGLGALAAPR